MTGALALYATDGQAQDKAGSYIRQIVDYDIAEECRRTILGEPDEIAKGGYVPVRDIPHCTDLDRRSLAFLEKVWPTVQRLAGERCLVAFGNPHDGRTRVLIYNTIAMCLSSGVDHLRGKAPQP